MDWHGFCMARLAPLRGCKNHANVTGVANMQQYQNWHGFCIIARCVPSNDHKSRKVILLRKLRRFCKIIARGANPLKRLEDKDMRISAYVHIVTGVTYLQHCHTGLLQKCHRGSGCGRAATVLHVKHNSPRTNRAMEIVAIGMESTLDRTQPRRELTNRSPQNDVIAGTRSARDPTPKTRRLR